MESDTSNLNFQNLTESKIDKFIRHQLKKLLSTEDELREWIEKFFTEKWYNQELERIKEFEIFAENIEDFQNDPVINRSYKVTGVDGKTKTFVKKSPDVDKSQIQESIKKVIPKYAEKAKKMLKKSKSGLVNFNVQGLKKKKKILKIISEKLSSYWEYLTYIRTAYVDIFNIIRLFRYSLTIKFLMNNIIMEIYDIDRQRWYREKIFGYKNVLKLLDEKL